MRSILVIGAGHFGYALIKELSTKDIDMIVIEERQDQAQLVKDLAQQVIVADAANKNLVQKFAQNIDCAIVCISEKIDSSVLITHYLKEVGTKKIIAKANSKDHGEILQLIGADEIIYPDEESAQRIARTIISPNIMDAINLSDEFDIIELAVPEIFLGKSIKELKLRNQYHIHILAIKNALTEEIKIMPEPDYMFKPDDIMIFVGNPGITADLTKL